MRISDWSSDVCSSDLIIHGCVGNILPGQLRDKSLEFKNRGQCTLRDFRLVRRIGGQEFRPLEDRKSVVEGKSVSVRVDLGGRRIIKKKHIYIPIYYHTLYY